MKKRLLFLAILLVALGGGWLWLAPRIRADLSAYSHHPHELDLVSIDAMHKSRMVLPNGIEVGLLHLKDGTDVKFWFVNRHVQPGRGTTRFDSADGRTAYLHGCFCCEVDVPEMANWNELQNYIEKWDGSPP